ncbi:hypothetical protein [Flammeovirga sp. SJP92]|uniref:hypothetical protein n=1 Tax=Flammeovirga sp. SJP92 TaxID=1775430 RepID=UPI000787994E|nr:hypothetical protein [Flammeovirga sp. SJP92]KXX69141.1 hypothetical protein AVL50_17025 [Flammeovirga sp. SJP92]
MKKFNYKLGSKNNVRLKSTLAIILFTLFGTQSIFAQDKNADEEIAKKLANPVASLISAPFQNNMDFGIGEHDGARHTMNVQPVVPIKLSKDINLITRMVLPVVHQDNVTGYGNSESGLGDMVLSGFFSPAKTKNGLIWGIGPAFLVPSATNKMLGTGKFGLGPTFVALKQQNAFTYGFLVNQIWSVAGDVARADVNEFYFQPFATYNWKSGAGASAMMELTQNWMDNSTTIWITPSISGVASLGKQKVQLSAGPRFNVAAPAAQKAKYGFRASITFIFPE